MKTQPNSIIEQVKLAIRKGFAWPGGYPLSLFTRDGAILCPDCAKENFRSVCQETKDKAWDTGWGIEGVDVCWEGDNHCDHCNKNVDAYPSEE